MTALKKRRVPHLSAVTLLWGGVLAWQAVRAYGACTAHSPATAIYWALLAASCVAALASRGRPAISHAERPTGAVGSPVALMTIALVIAMRLVERCAAP